MSGDRNQTILAIDDSPLDLDILREILKTDYRFQAATSAESAMEIIASDRPPDLVLLDILMPEVDGIELCRMIKTSAPANRIPVIFVTAKDAVEDEALGFEAGGVDYIVKPVNPHLLKARVRTHLELKRQNEILRENARLREEVEHISRHDLKNPLMVIMNVPTLLSRHPNITADQKALLAMVLDAGRKMLDMINRSIDLYRMETGTYEVHPVLVDALKVIRQIAIGHHHIVEEKKLRIDVMVRGKPLEETDSFHVDAEELLLYSMISNILRNALEASPRGERVTVALSGDDSTFIAIHNAGSIPERIRERFFEKYATAGKQGGTGLGAYSARLIARSLGGTIRCETSDETGTTITVTLPRVQ